MDDAQKWKIYHEYMKKYNDTLTRQRAAEKEYKAQKQRMKLAHEKLKPINDEIRRYHAKKLLMEKQKEERERRRILLIPKTVYYCPELKKFVCEI